MSVPVVLALLGAGLWLTWHLTGGIDLGSVPSIFGAGAPDSARERAAWIALAMTAGICEEIVYRAFALDVADRLGATGLRATGITSIPFILMHGPAALGLWPVYLAGHVGFTWLFRRTASVLPGVVVHTVIDLSTILRA